VNATSAKNWLLIAGLCERLGNAQEVADENPHPCKNRKDGATAGKTHAHLPLDTKGGRPEEKELPPFGWPATLSSVGNTEEPESARE